MANINESKENTIEYGLVLKGDWTEIVSNLSKKKADLKLIVFGTSESKNYVDWYFLIFGIGLGLRAKGNYGKSVQISNDTRFLIWTIFSVSILWVMVTYFLMKVL